MTESIINKEEKYNELRKIVDLHLFYMNFFKNDNYNYAITIDYRNGNNNDDMILEYRIKRLSNDEGKLDSMFNCTQTIKCEHLMAVEFIDEIRNNFILNHDIFLPKIEKKQIRIPNTLLYSTVICQDLKNNKFNLIVYLRTELQLKKALLAQTEVKEKIKESYENQKLLIKKD